MPSKVWYNDYVLIIKLGSFCESDMLNVETRSCYTLALLLKKFNER